MDEYPGCQDPKLMPQGCHVTRILCSDWLHLLILRTKNLSMQSWKFKKSKTSWVSQFFFDFLKFSTLHWKIFWLNNTETVHFQTWLYTYHNKYTLYWSVSRLQYPNMLIYFTLKLNSANIPTWIMNMGIIDEPCFVVEGNLEPIRAQCHSHVSVLQRPLPHLEINPPPLKAFAFV